MSSSPSEKSLRYRGDLKALVGRGGSLSFVTSHPEGHPTALYTVDLAKLELHEEPLPCGASALVDAGEDSSSRATTATSTAAAVAAASRRSARP
ncbi:MAG: hypothetical protein IPK80_11365 [Nannocystis sp.]|nr:hypothetical protein [Nannocystis sp.]